MGEGVAIALRFGVYLDLMLLFGLAVYPLYSGGAGYRAAGHGRLASLGLAMLGLALGIASFVVMTAAMAGVAVAGLDRETLAFVLRETGHGAAFMVQVLALLAAIGLALFGWGARGRWLVAAAAGVALGSLAWTGHAGATEALPGTVHRLSDVVHLLAAAAWIGALAMLLRAIAATKAGAAVRDAQEALAAFAVAGSVIVGLIIVTGIINSVMIVGLASLPLLPYTLYGQLLIAKLGLFALMLVLASLNRWRLTPRLDPMPDDGDRSRAVATVRTSLALEAGAAITILALVAWLGTLAPPSP
ncbi:MAG: copper homeostasis membrane protein CopD [Novosphingobium sp.]|nr:copper homeostasis membrane protein CopD [Novosphingobium sp.]